MFNYTQVENIKADYQRRIDELEAEIAARDAIAAKRLELWRGTCGHHWIKAESDACPVCVATRIEAARDMRRADGMLDALAIELVRESRRNP